MTPILATLSQILHVIPWATVVAVGGKLFVDAASTMPAPLEECGYLNAWFFDLTQTLASNKNRVGERRKPRVIAAPVVIAAPAPPAPAA